MGIKIEEGLGPWLEKRPGALSGAVGEPRCARGVERERNTMSETSAVAASAGAGELVFDEVVRLQPSAGLSVRLVGRGSAQAATVALSFQDGSGRIWARGELAAGRALAGHQVQRFAAGGKLTLVFAPVRPDERPPRWSLWWRGEAPEPVIEVCERCTLMEGVGGLFFPGSALLVQGQMQIRPRPLAGARFRLGAFTQHGQLLDLKDYFLVEHEGMGSGLLALRPGCWTQPHHNVLAARGGGGGLAVDLPPSDGAVVRRSYLLVHAPAAEARQAVRTGLVYFEPEEGYAAWPARQITRHGYARPERVAAYRRQAQAVVWRRPERLALGRPEQLAAAWRHVEACPELAGDHPFWKRDFAAARQWMRTMLTQAEEALTLGGYLHPRGNPVASRDLAPAFAVFHLLDVMGQLSEEDRRDAAVQIAVLAELLWRRDFYPWHVATLPAGTPGSVQHIYHGLLNQNFNTDRYAAVGLAGCVLGQHPHAAAWRRHGMAQFYDQMQAFVWPGGAWEESHTYAQHVRLCLIPMIAALRQAPEAVDLAADERFAACARFFADLLSPPDPILQNQRGIPAIGDHAYAHQGGSTYLFGWLATLCPEQRARYLWAWQQCGGCLTAPGHAQVTVFSPLLMPRRQEALAVAPPELPTLWHLPGYGAAARRAAHQPEESLLVVRCGASWGHYHPDQGSFWWWSGGRLVAADADLGSGPLKIRHRGHNVPGFPGLEPMQFLDRQGFAVDRCASDAAGGVTIRCQIPTEAWTHGPFHQSIPIARDHRPLVVRTFNWVDAGYLRVTDEPQRTPGGFLSWALHVPAGEARRTGEREVRFLWGDGGRLTVALPQAPRELALEASGRTWSLYVVYPAGPLTHELRVHTGA